jgi:hypothetical protein
MLPASITHAEPAMAKVSEVPCLAFISTLGALLAVIGVIHDMMLAAG